MNIGEKNNVVDEKKISEDSTRLKVKKINKSICPYCNHESEFIWVHGHYQCPFCKYVVIGCCGDE